MKTAYSQSEKLPIIPVPQSVKYGKGNIILPKEITIGVNNSELRFTAGLIKESLVKNLKATVSIAQADKDSYIKLTVISSEEFKDVPESVRDQGYLFSISKKGIRIESPSARGVFYGAMSLLQLLDKTSSGNLPVLSITDWPDMKVRGISDDISRGQVSTLANFEKIIREISRYKMNVYMPYLEDMIKFPQYPTIGLNRGALSPEEITKLVDYAKKYYVEIIPIFQTLGHYENILSQQEFLKYAEFPGSASLNVSNDSTYVFLDSMLKEVFKLFPSKYFHMGADESFDVGLGASKYLVDKYGIAKVHADHYRKIYDICKKYGKKVMMYGDIILKHPEILSMLPKDITIVDWHYRPDDNYPSAKIFKDAGFNYYVSPSVWNFTTPFPTNVNALPNITNIIKAGLENGSEGMINSNWGDFGAETFKELLYFGYAWSADCAWNFKGSSLSDFTQDYCYDFFGTTDERLPRIIETLSNPLNQMTWNSFWRHPLLNFREPNWWEPRSDMTAKISWMEWTLPQVTADIKALRKEVKKNSDQLDLLQYIVNLDQWYISKIKTEYLLHDKQYLRNPLNIPGLEKYIDTDMSSLKKLKNEYNTLWLKYYVKANLHLIDDKFDRLNSYFTEIKDSLKNGDDTLYSPLIKSDWIYVENKNGELADKAEFEKKIYLDKVPDEAYLQLMGDTYARLYINGKYVDEVFARRTLSLLVDYKRVKFLDVQKYLQKGVNTFLVKVENFNHRGAAGVNITSHFVLGNNILNIDTKADNLANSWKGKSFGSGWKEVVSQEYPFRVIAPDFSTKRPSWIER